MCSTASNRLHGIFTATKKLKPKTKKPKQSTAAATEISKSNTENPQKTTAGPTTTASAATISRSQTQKPAFKPLPLSHLTTALQNLKIFVDRFKRASNKGTFRYSYKYYDDVVSHLARAKQHSFIEEILEHQKNYKTEMTNEPFVARLISLYGKARMYDHARKLFDEMPELNSPRTVLSANALLTACFNSKRLEDMPELFRQLREEFSIEPDDVSYNIVIKAFCELNAIDSALLVVEEMEKDGCKCNMYTFNTIVDALYEKGNISEADKMWETMTSKNLAPDVRTYNAKVRGLIVDKRISEALELLEEMKLNGVKPDVYTYNGLIHGFVKEEDLVNVKRWYKEMVKNEIAPDAVTFRIIIPFASKKGDFRFGFELSRGALRCELNVGRLNLQGVLNGLVKDSNFDEAKELLEMVKTCDSIYYKLKLPVEV